MANNNLGRYKAEITADTTKFKKELGGAQKSSAALQKTSSEMSAAIGGIGGPVGDISAKIGSFTSLIGRGGLALGVFSAAVTAVGVATTAAVSHMAKLEVATAKTEALLKATGSASGFTAGQLDSMARSVALNTLASTNGVRDAQNALLTFKSISGPIFAQTIELGQDMAAVFGGDIKSSTVQLGKALEDPITGLTALRRVGVSFTEQQKDQIKAMVEAGDKANAQKLILSELKTQIGGAGKAEASGVSGAVDTLSQRWDDLLEAWDKTTGSSKIVTQSLNAVAGGLSAVATLINPGDSEKLQSMLRERAGLVEQIARVNNATFINEAVKAQDLQSYNRQLAEVDKRISDLRESRVERNNEAIAAEKKSAAIQFKNAAEEQARMEEGRLKTLKLSLGKEVSSIEDSLKTRLQKENEYFLKRSATLAEFALVEPDRQKEISTLLEAEHARHLSELEKMEAESLKKRRDERAKLAANDPKLAAQSKLSAQVGKDFDLLATPVSAIDQENKDHEDRMARLKTFGEQNLELKGFINSQIEAEQERHSKAIAAIETQSNMARLNVASSILGNLSALMNSESRKAFKIGKTAAIANATVSTYQAATSAYAAMAGIPVVGPSLGIAAAAAAIAAGVTNIQAIKSQKFGGGGTVTAGTSGGAGPGVYQPAQPTVPVGPVGGSQTGTNIYLNGNFSAITPESLAEMLAEHIDKTDAVIVSSTSRNGQILRGG